MTNIKLLKDELALGHPVTGAYSVDNQIATDELNVVNIDAEGGVDGVTRYLLTNRSKSDQGNDTVATSIMGRLRHLADSAVASNPFDRQGGTSREVTLEQKHAAIMLLTLVENPQLSTLDMVNTEFEAGLTALGGGTGARVMKPADIDAIKALSQNQQSRATQVGLGRVRVGDVEKARA